jgi:hypothetical protein
MTRSRFSGASFVLVLSATLAACSSDDDSTSSGGTGGLGGSAGAPATGGGGPAGAAGTGGSSAPGVRFVGRVDLSNPDAPKFAWSGTGFVAHVSGTQISVHLSTENSSAAVFYQPVIDGTPGTRFSIPNGEQTVDIGTGLAAGDHVVELYRESEGRYGDSVFLGFTSGTLGTPPAAPGRVIEIVGDSISAGFGNLGSETHPGYGPDPTGGCGFTTDTESAYLTYGAVAARALGADPSIIASSGWGIFRDNSGSTANVLPNIYGNTLGSQATPAWQWSPVPQAVVVNLGTNDFAQQPFPTQAEFSDAYTAFLFTVRSHYPEAFIYCAVGPLLWSPGGGLTEVTNYLTAVVAAANAAGDARVKLLTFPQQNITLGTGCSYHPNTTEDQAMADLLTAAVRTDLGW